MRTEVLLPIVAGAPVNIDASKTANPGTNGKTSQGFDIVLQAVNQRIKKSLVKMPGTMWLEPNSWSTVKHSQGTITMDSPPEAVDCISLEEMLLDVIPLDVLPDVKTGAVLLGSEELNTPIVSQLNLASPETVCLTREAGQLQSLPIDPALRETRLMVDSRLGLMGLTANPDHQDTQAGLPSGVIAEKPVKHTELIPVPLSNTVVDPQSSKEENVPNLKYLNYEDNQETAGKQTAQKTYSQEVTTLPGREQPVRDETQTGVTSATGQSNKVRHGEVVQPQQLITVESEKLHGVKTEVLPGSEGIMETSPEVADTVSIETPLVEKFVLPQKPVSTEDIIEQVVRKIELFTNPKSTAVTIKLEPEFLGRLQINLEVVDDVLTARFITDNLQVKHLLETGIGQLRMQLESSGIRLERAEVNIDLGHQFGGYHHNESGYQNRQPVPYEATPYYINTFISDSGPPEIEENTAPNRDIFDGSINYLI
ncbi:MAG: flagellar hook-length control protein FliK [Bacillota bacterium]